jgi:membrane-associated phospholipid phosphatase
MTMTDKNKEFFKKVIPLILIFIPIYYLSVKFNRDIFHHINGFQSQIFGYPMIFISAMADGLFVLMISSAVYKKKKGYFWTFILAYLLTSLIVQFFKHYFHFGRPLMHYSKDEIYTSGDKLTRLSFPSGHSASAMVLAWYLAEGLKTRWKSIIFFLGVTAGISRIYIGAHYPRDVTAGLAIGFLVSFIVFTVSKKRVLHANRPEYKYNIILVSLTGLISAIAYLYFHPKSYKPISGVLNLLAAGFMILFIYQLVREFFKIYRTNNLTKTINKSK